MVTMSCKCGLLAGHKGECLQRCETCGCADGHCDWCPGQWVWEVKNLLYTGIQQPGPGWEPFGVTTRGDDMFIWYRRRAKASSNDAGIDETPAEARERALKHIATLTPRAPRG